MIALVVLLASAAMLILGAPRLLRLRRSSVLRPRAALAGWLVLFAAGLAAVLASLIVTVVLASVAAAGPDGRSAAAALGMAAWAALAVVGGVTAFVATRAEPISADATAAARHVELLAAAYAYRRESVGGATVHFVPGERPVAFSAIRGGRHIVICSALDEVLTRAELRSVVEHERAHLAGRHDLVLRLARLNRACLPGLFGARAFDSAAHLLVELVADDAAARICGAEVVRSALGKSAELEANEWVRIRAARLAAGDGQRPGSILAAMRPAEH